MLFSSSLLRTWTCAAHMPLSFIFACIGFITTRIVFFFLFMVLDCIGKTGVNCFLFFFHYFSTNLKLFFPLLTY